MSIPTIVVSPSNIPSTIQFSTPFSYTFSNSDIYNQEEVPAYGGMSAAGQQRRRLRVRRAAAAAAACGLRAARSARSARGVWVAQPAYAGRSPADRGNDGQRAERSPQPPYRLCRAAGRCARVLRGQTRSSRSNVVVVSAARRTF